jgi:leucyl/phenylalanyl-tRNA--protein transferase
LEHPNGLLAAGGTLSSARLLSAYPRGIFPWYSEGQVILWWSPDPRMVLFPEEVKIQRSVARKLRDRRFRFTADQAFVQVLKACAAPGPGREDTWITGAMETAYNGLHEMGYAHSIEVWDGEELVGGLYGVGMGAVFFGESMFSRVSDASKMALVELCRFMQKRGSALIDCQVYSEHLESLGARELPRKRFVQLLERHCEQTPGAWRLPSPDSEPDSGSESG